MITESAIAQQLRDLLGSEVDAHFDQGRMRVLTPFEYPDGDGIVVLIDQNTDGRLSVSDGGGADASLIGDVSSRAISGHASEIARRFDATFDGGQLVTMVENEADLADACQRIARAAAGVAEASTYLRRQRPKEMEFVDVITSSLHERAIEVETQRKIDGASGHPHTATLFLPNSETVIEPIGGERAWNVAAAVYVEFGDLSQVNGYRLVAVVDDREAEISSDVSGLLNQVANVAYWGEREAWINEVANA